jgi:peroxiredoxin
MVSLDSLKGSKALVVFIPFPFTGICDDEGCALRDNLARLAELDAKVVIITVHALPVIKKWVEENGFEFPVLSDYWPHGEITKAYGAFNETTGGANRYTFVLDGDGITREVINTEALSIGREYSAYEDALGKF